MYYLSCHEYYIRHHWTVSPLQLVLVWSLNGIFSKAKRHARSLNLVQRKGAESAHRPRQYQMQTADERRHLFSVASRARLDISRVLCYRDVAISKSDGAIRPRKRVHSTMFIVILFKK